MEVINNTDFGALLNITDIKVIKTEIDLKGDFLVYTESTQEGTLCHSCGKQPDKPYGYDRLRNIRHLPIFGRNCYVIIKSPRYKCPHCHSTTTQPVPWCTRNSSYTIDFEKNILLCLVGSTIEDESIKQDIGYDAIKGIVKRYISTEINWDSIKKLEVIGIDEISLKKGHQDFVTIVTLRTGNETRILSVLKNKKKETVKQFFLSIPSRLRKTVRFVCSDMYDGFINAAKEVFSKKVKVVIDRFHIALLYRNNFENLRKSEMRRLKKELPDSAYKQLNNVMWVLRKKAIDHTDEDRDVLKIIFKHSSLLEVAYHLRNNLTDIFNTDLSKPQARRKLKSWIKKAQKNGLTCFNGFIKTLKARMDDILNYFIKRQTSGFVEGLNNKIKVIKRRCYGILNVKNLFQRIYLDLEGYGLFAR